MTNNLSFEIIPAIDLIDGKCVRLSQGDYAQKIIYNEQPLEVAKMFEEIDLVLEQLWGGSAEPETLAVQVEPELGIG